MKDDNPKPMALILDDSAQSKGLRLFDQLLGVEGLNKNN